MIFKISTLALACVLLFPNDVHAWAEHHILTRRALSRVPELKGLTVKVEPFSACLETLGVRSEAGFNDKLRIHRDFRFELKAGERMGREIPVAELLAVYSDEPDWKMDTHLFDEGQFPEIWDPAFKMMGGKTGTPSQAFRHMYWKPFDLSQPVATFRLPLSRLFRPMGEAPVRAMLFVSMARQLGQAGHLYWAVRFYANALHYVGDVSSPFHSTQTPTKQFVAMPFTSEHGRWFKAYVKQVTNIVSYYHFAFEDYIGALMKDGGFAGILEEDGPAEYRGSVHQLILDLNESSTARSARAGRASVAFFPQVTEPFDTFEPKTFMNEAWWEQTRRTGLQHTPVRDEYFAVVREMLRDLGRAIRAFSVYELKVIGLISAPKPAPPSGD
ncbi:MAG TPA: hypothetical protein VFV50_10685 [Bdellovibrionales bacterium]|nr:hypothetical protein [Bdellovibrionales bacterium]